jgi:NDP-sugar pyrophosphorylase family protein
MAIKFIILAGGLAKRMGDLTLARPKSLLPYRDITVLDHIIAWIRASCEFEIIIVARHLSKAIQEHVSLRYSQSDAIRVLVEPTPLGTGGAIKFACSQSPSDFYVILNGDTIHTFDLPLDRFELTGLGKILLIGTRVHKNLRMDCDYLKIHPNGIVREIYRLDRVTSNEYAIMYSGICMAKGDTYLQWPNSVFDNADLLKYWISHKRVLSIVTEGNSLDIGTPERYYDAR